LVTLAYVVQRLNCVKLNCNYDTKTRKKDRDKTPDIILEAVRSVKTHNLSIRHIEI